MIPYNHQVTIASDAYGILASYGMVYLAMEERTGKTLTAIVLAEMTTRTNVLVLTKKKALDGWYETLDSYSGDKGRYGEDGLLHWELCGNTTFTVTNYHQAVKLRKGYDLIILDESHSYLSAYPKRGTIWKSVSRLTKEQPLIYLSATPYAQGYQLLYNQLGLSSWSPFKQYKNFYRFFDIFGIPEKVRTSYGLQETYKKCKPVVWDKCKHLFITYTRKELGFEHEPEDILHYFELSESTKTVYNDCLSTELFSTGELTFPLDSSMKLRTTLHQLEGGVAKDDMEGYHVLPNKEKIDAILRDFGDTEDTVIMYHYKAELIKLRATFSRTRLLQATSYAEGVDLSSYSNLVIYSQDFSTARHSQRRARQANKERRDPINVHFYLVEGGISDQVYKTVSINKTNFVDSVFNKERL